MLNRRKMLPTWSLPIATRQNLLPWPASGSSSGSETPERGVPKNSSKVNTGKIADFRGKRHAVLTSIRLSSLFCNSISFPMKEFGKLSCLPLPLFLPEGLEISNFQHKLAYRTACYYFHPLQYLYRSETKISDPASAKISSILK